MNLLLHQLNDRVLQIILRLALLAIVVLLSIWQLAHLATQLLLVPLAGAGRSTFDGPLAVSLHLLDPILGLGSHFGEPLLELLLVEGLRDLIFCLSLFRLR